MEIDDFGRAAHGPRVEHQVEDPVSLETIVAPAQRALEPKTRIGVRKPQRCVFPPPPEKVRDHDACGFAVIHRGVNAARCYRGNEPRRITDQQHTGYRQALQRATTWDEARANASGVAIP